MGRMNELALVEARVAETWDKFWDMSDEQQAVIREEYRTVLQPALLAAYGEDADVGKVDPWLAESFSEIFKDRNGFRPSGFYSYRYAREWMDGLAARDAADAAYEAEQEPDTDAYYATDFDEDTLARLNDFEDVYGVTAFGQAARFMDVREY